MEKGNFKEIHIGRLISEKVKENDVEILRICNFLNCNYEEILKMYNSESLDTITLLRWSKLLKYDFFRIYTQHLILFSPTVTKGPEQPEKCVDSKSFQFRKNIYTKEIIDFILEQLSSGRMTKLEIVDEYRIPKTTLYKWINKYGR